MIDKTTNSTPKRRIRGLAAGALILGLAAPFAAQAKHDDDGLGALLGAALVYAHYDDHRYHDRRYMRHHGWEHQRWKQAQQRRYHLHKEQQHRYRQALRHHYKHDKHDKHDRWDAHRDRNDGKRGHDGRRDGHRRG